MSRCDAAIFVCAKLDSCCRGGGGAASFEHLFSGHSQFDGAPCLPGEQSGNGSEVGRRLAAKPAPYLQRDDLHRRFLFPGDHSHHLAYAEGRLRAHPDGHAIARVPQRRRHVGLDVALMDCLRGELTFGDHRGSSKPLSDIPPLNLKVAGHVASDPGVGALPQPAVQRLCLQALVEQRGVLAHRLLGAEYRREDLVRDVDQLERFFGDVDALGGHRRHGMPFVEHLARRKDILSLHPVVIQAGSEVELLGLLYGHVLAGDDRFHPRQRQSTAAIDGEDTRVGVRAAKHLAVEEVSQEKVGAVPCAAGDLVIPVVADGPGADDAQGFGRRGGLLHGS